MTCPTCGVNGIHTCIKSESEIEESTALVKTKSLAIQSSIDYSNVMEFGNLIKNRIVSIENYYEFEKNEAHKRWQGICESVRSKTQPFKEALVLVDRLCTSWRREEKKMADLKADEARKAALRAAEEERIKIAEKYEKANHPEQALKILDVPIVPKPIAIPMAAIPIMGGASFRENWKVRIVDESLIPREFLIPDEKKINQIVKAMKSATRIPGVEVYCEEVTARRGRE